MIAVIDEANQARSKSERVSLRRACALLGVSAGGYYAWKKRRPSQRQRQDAALSRRLIDCHQEAKGRYGIRRLDAALRRQGHHHSHRRLRRLARAAGLRCVHPASRANTTVAGGYRVGLVDLIDRDFVAEAPGQVLYTDITYIPTRAHGWVYLVVFTDAASRRIVSWNLATHMDTTLVTQALDRAISDLAPSPGQLIVHSDQGSQFTARAFRNRCFSAGVLPSVGGSGSCFDNAAAESVNATIKKELINLHQWDDIDQVRLALFEYIDIDYNRHRLHSALGFRTPKEYEQQHQLHFTQAA